ncbi:MAG TPA: CoA-binding protein [candidate division Zixibacteria bacterium]|nr:CoA-binding protein [candidate division Zixibacteria bacterium]
MIITERHELDGIFNPTSIAVVGASSDPDKAGHQFFRGLIDLKFNGDIYPINLEGIDVLGFKGYRNLMDIPGPVDYVTVAIPAHEVPKTIEDCSTKGVKVAHIFSSGFSETGKEDRIKLETQIVDIAKRGNVHIIGPNCMGIYHPKIGLSNFGIFTSKENGPVCFISQSGGNNGDFARMGLVRGLRFSKLVSYGNGCDLDSTDFIGYFTWDPETKVICAYIEGVKDGRRFIKSLKEATTVKPVIILKGGLTEAGTRAVSSHTGALAGSDAIWKSLFRQTKAVQVESLGEMIDVALAFSHMPCPKGRRAGIVGIGGGASVAAADSCERAGLVVPPFMEDTMTQLEKITPIAGTGVKNPVDSPVGSRVSIPDYEKTLKLVASDPQIDFLIVHVTIDWYMRTPEDRKNLRDSTEALLRNKENFGKPAAAVLRSSYSLPTWKAFLEEQKQYLDGRIPVYLTLEDAANAISRLIQYHEFRKELIDL